MRNIEKKTAVVTGGRRGIGLAIVEKLISNGYFCIIADVVAAEDAKELLSRLNKSEQSAEYVQCDISRDVDRRKLLEDVKRISGKVDLLVNNAGVGCITRDDVLSASEESFDRLININLKGTFFMTQLFAGVMIDYKKSLAEAKPRIINISSISAYTSSTNRGEYCISKAGISMVTKLFADRLAEFEIPVFEVRPGIILTDMTTGVKEKYKKLIEEGVTPIKRFGKPEDVAAVVAAAAGGGLDFGTGTVLNADGGFHIRRL